MLDYKECIKSRLEIIHLQTLQNNTIAIAHKYKNIKTITQENCTAIHNFNLDLLGDKTSAVAFEEKEQLMAIANKHIIYIINMKTALVVQTILSFDGDIQKMAFVPNSNYIVTGSSFGRVMLYRVDGFAQICRICSFPIKEKRSMLKQINYVSALAFYQDYIACSGYGGDIVVMKLSSLTNRQTIINPPIKITALAFIDKHNLISGNLKGEIVFHNLVNHHQKTIITPFSNINQLLLVSDNNYALITAKQNNTVAIIDIQRKKVLKADFLEFLEDIKFVALDSNEEQLIITLQSNKIVTVNIVDTHNLEAALQEEALALAYEIAQNNPILKQTHIYKHLERIYDAIYKKVIEGLIHQNNTELKQLITLFKDSDIKKDEIASLTKSFEYYPRFKALCRDNKLALAYTMADKYKELQYTPEFEKLEERFKADFTFAQKQMLLENIPLAQEILTPYLIVQSKKSICQLLLRHNHDFIEFLKALQTKSYKKIFTLAQKHTIFQEVQTYQQLLKEIDDQLHTIYQRLRFMQVENTLESLKKLQNIPHIDTEVKNIYYTIHELKKLLQEYNNNNFKVCYEIIDTTPLLQDTRLGTLLEKHWNTIIDNCEKASLKGDIKGIKTTLDTLIRINTRKEKIGNLLRTSFQTKIKQLLKQNYIQKAEYIIYSYIDIFGFDSELKQLIIRFEKRAKKSLAITVTEIPRLSRDNWMHSDLIMNS